jgi:arsenical pump membrane protein
VWLANTASLLLPISNLTNLLAQHRLGGITPMAFATFTAAPALVAVLVPVALAGMVFRRDLRRRYTSVPVRCLRPGNPGRRGGSADRVLLGASAGVLAALLPALISGLPVWLPSTIAALLLAAVFVGRPTVLTPALIPWSLLLFCSGLFPVMEAARHLGLPAMLTSVAGTGTGPGDLFSLAGAGAAGSNLVNNLPAYLALEPVAGSPDRLLAVLIVNAGPVVTPWASRATLLWHDRLAMMNVLISWWGYAIFGLILAPAVVGLSVRALILTRT